MRVAIVGCGQIARMHIAASQGIGGQEIVAVCDRDESRARAALEWAPGARAYGDLSALLHDACPEVVHILTPPATHAALAVQAMEAGCHVLVEKPMALSPKQAAEMVEAARRHGVKLATNHNYLRKPSIQKARALVAAGSIGEVLFVDSYYGLSGEGGSFEGSGGHWAARLPGGAFTNFLPHLIYLQREFLGDVDAVSGVAVHHGQGRAEPPTELVVLLEGRRGTGTMTFSILAKPYAKFVDVYGTHGIIHADLVREVCTIRRQRNLPRLLTKVLYNAEESAQLIAGTALNTARVALGQMKNMPELPIFLGEFYESIRLDREPPAGGEDGRRMVEVMEQVWAKMPTAPESVAAAPPSASRIPASDAERRIAQRGSLRGKILVTGATGFLGRHVVAALWRSGADVVALVRDKSRAPRALEHQATIVEGDVADAESIAAAMRGVAVVIHCAAVTRNNVPWAEHHRTNVRGAEVVFRAAHEAGVGRVVHVSSVIVNGNDASGRADLVTESAPYAENVDRWSHYQRSKIEAERIAFELHHRLGLPVTVIRPGIIYGPGAVRSVERGLARLGRVHLSIGSGTNVLPYTYIDNVVDAILLAAVSPDAAGRAYNIVDEPPLPVREWTSRAAALREEPLMNVPVPPLLLSGVARLLEAKRERDGSDTPPRLSRFVVASAISTRRYDVTRARSELGWHPSVTPDEGLRRTLNLPVDARASQARTMSSPEGRPVPEPWHDRPTDRTEVEAGVLVAGPLADSDGAREAPR